MVDEDWSQRYDLDPIRSWLAGLALVVLGLFVSPVSAQVRVAGRDQGFVPYSEEPIRYLSDGVDDPVAKLQERIDRGEAELKFEPGHGYLESVLNLLEIPVSSQTLVFSKSSFQYRKISPRPPRALYFNDNVYVGWVRDGHSLELASFDPNQGAMFYLLDQKPAPINRPSCTPRWIAPSVMWHRGRGGYPGVLLRSIYTRPTGTQATEGPGRSSSATRAPGASVSADGM